MPSFDTRRYYPRDIDLTSITSSNITADNLPGPGRILGNIYRNLGKRLEGYLNSFAESRGSGPRAVALRIRERDSPRELRFRHILHKLPVTYTRDSEEAEQRKDIKKLVQYAKCADN